MATSKPCNCTHLNVHQKRIVNLSSQGIPPDNSGGHPFYYDRQVAVFTVPQGWSFVVTDIIVASVPLSGPLPDPTRYTLAVISFTNMGERLFVASVLGDATQHYALTAGYVIPAGHTPTFRNTTFSSVHAEAELLGYFVPGDALGPGESAFPLLPGATAAEAGSAAPPPRPEPLSRS